MGYMQEIIRRGNVKYFISQKQKEQNKPTENLNDIGEGSAWYVQDNRPIYEEAVLLNGSTASSYRTGTQRYSAQWYSALSLSWTTAERYDSIIGKNSGIDIVDKVFLFKPPWMGNAWTPDFIGYNPLQSAMRVLLLEGYSKELLKTFCYKTYDFYILDLEGQKTGLPFYIYVEPYNVNYEYMSILNSKLSTPGAKLGIRLDTENRIYYIGCKGKIFLPQECVCYFNGVMSCVYANSNRNKIISTPPLNYLETIKLFSDTKTLVLQQSFAAFDFGLYQSYEEIPAKKKQLDLTSFTFSSVIDMGYAFSNIGAFQSNIYFSLDMQIATNTIISTGLIEELNISTFNTSSVANMVCMFAGNPDSRTQKLKKIFVGDSFTTQAVTQSFGMFENRQGLVGGAGTVWSSSNPTDKTYAHWDEGPSNPGYFWNPNVMDPLVLVPGPQFNQAWLAAVNAAAIAADSDRAPSVQQITGEFNFITISNKPANLLILPNNDVKESGDGEAYIGYTYNVTDRSFKVYLVSDNIGQNNIKANSNCKDMFALDDTIKGSLTMNIEWLNTSQVTNMENMFGYKGVY